ncbi:MAG: hypothetical protein ACKO0Z_05090 [Betaproteobacteria bacterium]
MSEQPTVFQLTPRGTKAVETISPIGRCVRMVIDDDWDYTRAKIHHAALATGARSVILVNGNVELYEKRFGGERPSRINDNGQHGLWLYMGRLLRRYGHVYVPHMKTWQETHPYFNCPSDGMVVGYQTAALQKLGDLYGPLGRQLCREGYDSFTVSDYFYYPLGEEVFKEVGTHATWQAAYLRSFEDI